MLLDIKHGYICKMWFPTLYIQQYSFLKVTNESAGLVRFESYSFSCFASLPSLVLPLCQLVFCLSSSVRLSTCLYPGKRLEIRCQMTLALSCFFPIWPPTICQSWHGVDKQNEVYWQQQGGRDPDASNDALSPSASFDLSHLENVRKPNKTRVHQILCDHHWNIGTLDAPLLTFGTLPHHKLKQTCV